MRKLLCLIFILTSLIILGCSSTSNSATYQSTPDFSSQAVKLVQNYGSEDTTILKTISSVLYLAKQSSNKRIEVIGWSAYKKGDLYEVIFELNEGDKKVEYTWEADLQTGKVYAVNDNADTIMNIINSYN